MRYNLLAVFVLILTISGYSQNRYYPEKDSVQPWWEYGVQFGAFLADNYSADFYNGEGVNDITRITEAYDDEIRNAIQTANPESSSFNEFRLGDLPRNMGYNTASMPGLHLEYHSDSTTSFFINFQYIKLRTSGNLIITDPNNDYNLDNDFMGRIRATEERVFIDIGIRQSFQTPGNFSFYLTGGVNINNTTVMSHKIDIATFTRSIQSRYSDRPINTGYPTNNYNFKQGGIGIGIVGGGGVKLSYQQSLYAAIDLTAYYSQTILPGREEFGIHVAPMLRLGYKSATLFP